MRVLIVDNYDSFTYNLVHLFEELGAEVVVRRNDAVTVEEAEALAPDRLVVSPGPGRPEDAGVSVELIRTLGSRVPTLGVCLGHQAIVEAYGGEVGRAQVDEPVAGVQHAGAAAHPAPAGRRLRGIRGLAVHLAVELEHGVAAQDERVRRHVVARGHGRALELGQLEGELGRRQPVELGLVDPAHDDDRVQACRAQRRTTCGGGRGQHQARHRRSSAARSGSSPSEPRSSAARWKALRSKSSPCRCCTRARASSQMRSPTLYDGAWPGRPR